MYRSVLVPLDGSAHAEHALPFGVRIAQQARADLQLVAVMVQHLVPVHSPDYHRQRWQAYLDDLVKRTPALGTLPFKVVLLEGNGVVSAIVEHVAQSAVDLIVLATHGRGALGRYWFGSIASELAGALSVPFLFIRPDHHTVDGSQQPSFDHLLLTLDGSPRAEKVLEPAVVLGSLFGAEYTLLRVVRDIPFDREPLNGVSLASPAMELLDEIDGVQKKVMDEAGQYLDGIAAGLRGRGMRVHTRVCADSDPALAIIREAAAPIRLTAMAARGSRAHTYMRVGSVTRKCLSGSPVPILIQSPETENGGG